MGEGVHIAPLPVTSGAAAGAGGGRPRFGRDAELDQLIGLFAETGRTGRPVVGVVEGELGVGKSWLLEEFADRCRALGIVVRGEAQLRDRSVLRELERSTRWAHLALLVDDARLADPVSLEVVAEVVSRAPAGVVVLIGSRTRRFPRQLCSALDHAPDAVRWTHLAPLREADTARLLVGESVTRQRALHAASGGNPRYLKILASAADDTLAGLSRIPTQLDDRVEEALDRVVTTELWALDEAERAVIHAAALLGEDVDFALMAEVAELTVDVAAGAVDELVAAGLLCDDSGNGGLGFPHPLVRAAAYRLSGPGGLVLGHRRAAECLRRRGASVVSQAQHLEHAAQLGDMAAVEVLAAAAKTMLSCDPAASAGWVRVALRIAPQNPETERCRSRLRVLLAKALMASGQLDTARAVLGDLRGLTSETRPSAVQLLASTARLLGDLPVAKALASAELRRAGDRDTRPGLWWEVVVSELLAGRCPPQEQIAVALNDATTLRRHPGMLAVAATLRTLSAVPGSSLAELTGRLQHASELVDGLDDGTLGDVLDVLVPLGWVELLVERDADARRHADRGLALAQRHGQRHVAAQLHPVRALAHCRSGSIAESLRAADHAVAAAEAVGSAEMATFARLVRLRPLWLRQGTTAAAAAAAELKQTAELGSAWHQMVGGALAAEVLLALGKTADGTNRLSPWPTDGAATVRALAPWSSALRSAARLAAGDITGARRWLELASDQVKDTPLAGQLAAVASAETAVLLGEGQASAAVDSARTAVDHFTSANSVVRAAQGRMVLAEALRRDGQLTAARHELGRAREMLAGAGAEWLAAQAQRAQRRLGARQRRYGQPNAGRCLTSREREVAELVAQGLSNRAIATSLYLSTRTVDAHVSRILTKLDVPSRAAIARYVTEVAPA